MFRSQQVPGSKSFPNYACCPFVRNESWSEYLGVRVKCCRSDSHMAVGISGLRRKPEPHPHNKGQDGEGSLEQRSTLVLHNEAGIAKYSL